MAVKIQLRRDTALNWTNTNPTLSQGEVGFETDSYKIKIGDGTTDWINLPYYSTMIENFSFTAARNRTFVTNQFLQNSGGTFTNVSPFLMPYDATLSFISAGTATNETWAAEVWVNGSQAAVLNLSSTTADTGAYSINLNENDKVSFYCNGSGVDRPRIIAHFRRR
jgi:hypothetical protein